MFLALYAVAHAYDTMRCNAMWCYTVWRDRIRYDKYVFRYVIVMWRDRIRHDMM